MDIAYCAACQHVSALHAGRGRGHCRLNGCPCDKLVAAPAFEPATETAALTSTGSAVSVEMFTAILTAIAFLAGLLVGALVGINL